MTEWNHVNTQRISRIGYNREIKTLYIDFVGSDYDIPYKNVSEETFIEFSQAERIDKYYEIFIKDIIEPTYIDTDSNIIYQNN